MTYCDLHLAPVILEEEPTIMMRRQVVRGIMSPRPLAAASGHGHPPSYHPPITLGREIVDPRPPAALVPVAMPASVRPGVPNHVACAGKDS